MSVFISTPCLSLWERWPSKARTERGNRGAIPSQSPTATALPKGEPRGMYHGTKNGAHLPCLSLWERWTSKARRERENRGAKPSQSPSVTALPEGEPRGVPRHEKWRASPLPLPLGEVDERSEDGEGRPGAMPSQSPSVTALPKGEPRGVYRGTKNGAHLPCLSLWERWTSKARTERGN